MLKKFLGKHIAVIVAHPDDESVLSAGTIIAHIKNRGTVSLFSVTLGEKGSAYMDKPVKAKEVSAIRKKELIAVAKYIGIKNLVVGRFPDSKTSEHKPRLKKEIVKFISKVKPDVVISFGADGYTGHADHIAVGQVVKSVVKKNKIELWEFSKPPVGEFPDIEKYLSKKRKNGLYRNTNKKVAHKCFSVKVDPKLKLKVLKLYKTQFPGINPYNIFPKKIAEHLLGREYFTKVKVVKTH